MDEFRAGILTDEADRILELFRKHPEGLSADELSVILETPNRSVRAIIARVSDTVIRLLPPVFLGYHPGEEVYKIAGSMSEALTIGKWKFGRGFDLMKKYNRYKQGLKTAYELEDSDLLLNLEEGEQLPV